MTHSSSNFLHVVHQSVPWCSTIDNYACALAETLISRFRANIQAMLCFIPVRAIDSIYACAFSKQTKNCVVLLNLIYFHVFTYFNSKLQTTTCDEAPNSFKAREMHLLFSHVLKRSLGRKRKRCPMKQSIKT